jgi:hypothetical protein
LAALNEKEISGFPHKYRLQETGLDDLALRKLNQHQSTPARYTVFLTPGRSYNPGTSRAEAQQNIIFKEYQGIL